MVVKHGILIALRLCTGQIVRGRTMGFARREALRVQRMHAGRSAKMRWCGMTETHLVEEPLRVVRPRDAGKLYEADLIGKPLVVVGGLNSVDGSQRSGCGADIDREEVTALE